MGTLVQNATQFRKNRDMESLLKRPWPLLTILLLSPLAFGRSPEAPTLAVRDLTGQNISGNESVVLSDQLRSEFIKTKNGIDDILETGVGEITEKSAMSFARAVESRLFTSARDGNIKTLTSALSLGADIAVQDTGGWTALHYAALQGHLETVKMLLQKGSGINSQNAKGVTALYAAASEGRADVVAFLLREGADVDKPTNRGATPLFGAAYGGYIKTIEILLQHGADVNALTKDNDTALHFAAQEGQTETVRLLLDKGAKYVTTDAGSTPFGRAKYGGHSETAQLLRKYEPKE